MKKVKLSILGLVALLLCATVFMACSKDENQATIQASDFKTVGIEHNKVLEKTFNNLKNEINKISKTQKSNYIMPSDQILEISENAITSEIIYNSIDIYYRDIALENVEEIFNDTPITENGNLYTTQVGSQLTNNTEIFLDDLNVILTDEDLDLISLKNRISTLENDVLAANLTESEQVIIYSATNTAKYSLDYWNRNLETWDALIGNNTTTTYKMQRRFNWKSVGKNDVAGAIGGAVAAGIANLFGPVGWAGYGSTIIGGAAGASAYDAAMQLMN